MGAKDPAIDALIAVLLEARERPAFISAVRALDRTLMSGFYPYPLFNVAEQWIARWDRIERPATSALTGYLPETWWQKADPRQSDATRDPACRVANARRPVQTCAGPAAGSPGAGRSRSKPRVTGQTGKRLSYARQTAPFRRWRHISSRSGLPANSVIAVQLPNTVEFALTVLAANRAGLVVAPLPLLWRQAELTAALNRTAARAIVTTSRVDGVVYADLAMNAAAEAFSIRHVCGFGNDLPEGMASLDQAILRDRRPSARSSGRPQGSAGDYLRRDHRRHPSGTAHAPISR